jgi:2-phosphoglycerate kinase
MDRDWDVLLIGGGGGVGKTYVGAEIAAALSISVVQADDIRLVLQRAIPAATMPDLHFFLDADITRLGTSDAVEHQLRIGQYLADKLEIVIRHHIDTAYPVVMEGDAILPELAVRMSRDRLVPSTRVRAVFIEETDPEQIYSALSRRGRGRPFEDEQRRWAEFHHAHGLVLANLARQVGVPVVQARPQQNLAARVQKAVRD